MKSVVFYSKTGKHITFRYPRIDDLDEMTRYINELSQEDTYVTFSGETISREEEEKSLNEVLKGIMANDSVLILCFDNDILVGVSDIQRDKSKRKRSRHIGRLGISLAKDYRGEGIGKELMGTVIEEAIKHIHGLKSLLLDVYAPNEQAIEMYKKLGFREVGRIPRGCLYKGEYVDQITMWKEI